MTGSSLSEVDPDLCLVGKKVGLEIWRVKQFKIEPVPITCLGCFYSGDAYVVLNTKSLEEWDVHFWIGKEASQDEVGVAAIKTVEIDQALGGFPVQHREVQGNESFLFLSYFPDGIRYVNGGYDSGYKHIRDLFDDWKTKLFHCKGKRNIRCAEVPCDKSSLNLGDVFILDAGRVLYVWMPPKSGRLERVKGMARAANIAEVERHGESKVVALDEDWDHSYEFWKHFGGKDVIPSIADAKNDDEDYWKRHNDGIQLWKCSDSSGAMQVFMIARGNIHRDMLDTNDAFILDAARGGIYVWVGRGCTLEERGKALIWGEQYLEKKNLPLSTQITRVLEGTETIQFSQWFEDWTGKDKEKGTYQPRLFQVTDSHGKLEVEEIGNFTQKSLVGDDVMILDAVHTVYVWIGCGATKNERDQAEGNAQRFIKEDPAPRKKCHIDIILEGDEPPTFKHFFPSWDDKMFKGKERSVAQMRELLFH